VILGKEVSKFYLYLWAGWALRLTFSSISSALFLATILSGYLYIAQGMPPITDELKKALFDITKFWFLIFWTLTLLLFLFRTLKSVFNSCFNHYKLQLLTCPDEGVSKVIEEVGYGDLVKVWRKWFMLIIWLVGAQMVLALIATYLFTTDTAAALRAVEMNCDALLKGTQVDGVYDADPKTQKDAKRYQELSYQEVLAQNLRVMDTSAIALARENEVPILVFSIHNPGGFADVVFGGGKFTIIN